MVRILRERQHRGAGQENGDAPAQRRRNMMEFLVRRMVDEAQPSVPNLIIAAVAARAVKKASAKSVTKSCVCGGMVPAITPASERRSATKTLSRRSAEAAGCEQHVARFAAQGHQQIEDRDVGDESAAG